MEAISQATRVLSSSQGWFLPAAWLTFFAGVFATIRWAFWVDPPPLHGRDITPLPADVTPESLAQYIQKEFTPKVSLVEKEIEEHRPEEAKKMVGLLLQMSGKIKKAIDGADRAEHNYTLVTSELAKIDGLAAQLYGAAPSYPKVPHAALDTRVLPSYGLANEVNTCFINTILQIVFVVPELVQHIVFGQGQHLIVREHYLVFKKLHEAGAFAQNPKLSSALRNLAPQFNGYGQHDAFEFLLKVLVDPLKKEENPLFFRVEERCYYHDYATHQGEITEHFEDDGGRIPLNGRELFSSLQLVLSEDPFSSMEQLIERTFIEDYPEQDDLGVEFERGIGEARIRLQLAKKHFRLSPPPFIFVDFKRFSVTTPQFGERGTFAGAKNTTPVAFSPIFFIPPECIIDRRGAKYEWVALVNGGGFGGGHYVADVRTSDGSYYEYSDSSKRELSEQAFIEAGMRCYGGFARQVECADVAREMEEHQQKAAIDQEIRRAVHGKYGDEKELQLIALFNSYLNQADPSIECLQKVYDQLSPAFHTFVAQCLPEGPRNRLIELKEMTKPLLHALDGELSTHIVAQYEHARKQNLALARVARPQAKKEAHRLKQEKALLDHLLTLNGSPDDQAMAAAILDPGLEKLLKVKDVGTLLSENAQEEAVLEFKQINADIRTGSTL